MVIGESDNEHQIFCGMNRPPQSSIVGGFREFRGVYLCSCGRDLWSMERILEHWRLGCFDQPIYCSLKEYIAAGGKVEKKELVGV